MFNRFRPLLLSAVLLVGFGAVNCTLTYGLSASPEAIAMFEQRVTENPKDYLSRTVLAGLYLREFRDQGKRRSLKNAEEVLRVAIASKPDHVPALSTLASTLMTQHRFAEAEGTAKQALALGERTLDLLFVLGDAQLEQGNLSATEETYKEANAKATDTQPGLYSRIARLRELQGREKEAEASLRQALAAEEHDTLDPDDLLFYRVKLGEYYLRKGNIAAARKLYDRALKERPTSAVAMEHVAEILGTDGKFKEALALIDRAVATSARPELRERKAELLLGSGSLAPANAEFSAVADLYRASTSAGERLYAHHFISVLVDGLDRPGEALPLAEAEVQERRTAATLDSLAWTRFKLGDFAGAESSIEEALALGAPSAHVLQHAAVIAGATGKLTRSKELFAAASKSNPLYAAFHFHR